MPRPERNGDCQTCDGRIRHYPDEVGGPGAWAHLNRADWLDNPHDPVPTNESIDAARIPS